MDLAAWFQELRRRRVIRAMLGWGLFSFAVLQVVEPVQHALRFPDWTLQAVVAILAIGFPVTAGLAWAFDLTRTGVERTAPPEGPSASTAARWSGARPAVTLTVVGALIGAGVAWFALRHAAGPAPVVDADGRVSVAVADFANQTGEPALDALSGLLITSLEQSRKLKVLTRGRMLELLRQGGQEKVERIDESLARQVGAKVGVRALLLASIQKLGPSYVVELRALDPQRDHYLFTVREQAASQAEILPLIDRLSDQARLRLRESDTEVRSNDVQLATAVTPNLEAYRHYFKGKELRAQIRDEEAQVEFRKALAEDPRFALAQLELAWIAAFWGENDLALFQEALANSSRLPEKEREIVQINGDLLELRPGAAAARARRLLERYPEDREVLLTASQAAIEPAEALRIMRRLVALAPDLDQARIYSIQAAAPLGLSQDFLAEALDAERARPSSAAATSVALARLGSGDVAGAVADLQRAGRLGPNPISQVGLFFGILLLGDVAAAREMSEAAGPGANYLNAAVDAREGRLRAASDRLARLGESPGMAGTYFRRFRAVIHAAAGDRSTARRLAEANPVEVTDLAAWLFGASDEERRRAIDLYGASSTPGRWLRATSLRESGDLEGAVVALGPVDPRDCGYAAWLLGTLESERGRHAEAIPLLRQLEPCHELPPVGLLRFFTIGESRIRLARGLAATGRQEEARTIVTGQIAQWKNADPDFPLLVQAKALCAELRC